MIDPKTIEMMEAEWRDRLEHAVQQARINTVKQCLKLIEWRIIRNGNTPENIRTREHLTDIINHFGVE